MLEYTRKTVDGRTYMVVGNTYYAGCKRCNGTGHYSFDGESSICYLCRNVDFLRLGSRIGSLTHAERRSAQLNLAQQKRDRERAARAEKALKALADAQDALPEDVRDFLRGVDLDAERSDYVRSLADRFHSQDLVKWGLTHTQIDVVRSIIRARAVQAEARAEPGPVEEGRREIEGAVRSVKLYDGDYGSSAKMVVDTDTGHRVFGTVPASLLDGVDSEGLVGRRVRFTAAVERSRDDESFGFFKRPTKAGFIE